MRFYVATLQLVGNAEHSDAFHELILAALRGDDDALERLEVGRLHVIIGPEVTEPTDSEGVES